MSRADLWSKLEERLARKGGAREDEYEAPPLRRRDLAPDPYLQFSRWFAQAIEREADLPHAAVLATASRGGSPSARVILLKGFDERGLVFFTSYASRKGGELAENPQGSLVFYWARDHRQVRVEGKIWRLPASESEAYFAQRPRRAQLAARISAQSREVANRAELEESVKELDGRMQEVTRPTSWGGYILTPEAWEFWQGRRDRLHDRFLYRPPAWSVVRLAP